MSPTYEPEVADRVRELTRRIEAEIPELREVLVEARAENDFPPVSETEALRRALAVVATDPTIAARLEALAAEVFAPLKAEEAHPITTTHTEDHGFKVEDIVVPAPFGVGSPRMHPTYESALLERLQYDGDAPELRFGAMPDGGTPAVPVQTDARNPIALGWMLEKASEEVAKDMRQLGTEHLAEADRFLSTIETEEDQTALAARGSSILAKIARDNIPEPKGYERGKLPARREIELPDGGDLAGLTSEQRGQLAWKFLSTTQGRRSATHAIRELIWTKLRSDGFAVVLGEGEPGRVAPETVCAHAEWVVDLTGPNTTQPSFAFVDMAAMVLVRKLEQALPEGMGAGTTLEVLPVNTVNVRKVGWAARLLQQPA